ncbi:MAG: acyl-CoA reductase [Bacteroidota bacterium]|nr:acyl-CoA reductase [Bacteroidota bacterium]
MDLNQRIKALAYWGKAIQALDHEEMEEVYFRASGHNSWFTRESVNLSLEGIVRYLDGANLEKWMAGYTVEEKQPKSVGLVMAGNIPLAGFHDFLTVLITGNKVQAKLSSQDPFLLPYLAKMLIEIEPLFKDRIEFVERLKNFDAIIATGSDNSARYFNYYFGKYPHIIRQNRTSCAILKGDEPEVALQDLGKDIFQYFGLGCRNVSKIFVPKEYDITDLFKPLEPYGDIINHHKFNNNYDYNKSIFLVNAVEHLDFGFLLLRESEQLVSPISVLYYVKYGSDEDLNHKIEPLRHKIQCVVAPGSFWPGSIAPGTSQKPELWDYADDIDTVAFILAL